MQLKRAKFWFSPDRLKACRRLFQNPWQAHLGLAFFTRRPVEVILKNGRAIAFSRAKRDHMFWDWFLGQSGASFDFTPDGLLHLKILSHEVLLRPGSGDFFAFREIFLEDCYGLGALPERLGTVVDLGGNVGLFTCAVLGRADRVITVEAVEAHCRLTRQNILLGRGNPENLLRYAVAGGSGQEAVIHVDERNAGSSSLLPRLSKCIRREERVPTISLEDLLDKMDCRVVDLLKCDVEGAEFDIFQSADLAVLRRIRRLVMEVHLQVDQAERKEQALVERLRQAGLAVTLTTPTPACPLTARMLRAHRP
jgi:FkbM family methyltransferase